MEERGVEVEEERSRKGMNKQGGWRRGGGGGEVEEGRWRGGGGMVEGWWRGGGGEVEGRWRGGGGEVEGRGEIKDVTPTRAHPTLILTA